MTELPTTFGKYYLTEKLATGGMAEIYLAKLIGPGGFEKQLVIKQIHPELSHQRRFVDLFVAEAKTLVTLAHGNIVPVYELGVIDDTYFIAMEYIDGPTLYRLTEIMAGRGARMEPSVAAWIAARILEGLDYAHRKGEGVIHRDLSPRNVMLSRDGEVKLVDFGIAVTLGEPGDAAAPEAAPTGSFPYMSPEQVRREPLTPQTDLFSLGVLVWEMLAGERLFARAEADATLEAVLHAEIARPSTRRAEVPERLDEVVMKALERDRGARWNDAAEMLEALQRFLYGLEEMPGPREVAALVARFCPPESRRLPTHVEAAGGAVGGAVAEPKGKRPKRHQTFATHVELRGMLEKVEAQEDRGPTTAVMPRDAEKPAQAGTGTQVSRRSRPRMDVVEEPIARPRETLSRGALVVAGLGAIALGVASVVAFYRGRERILEIGDAQTASDAAPDAPRDAAPADAAVDAAVDAPPPDASAPRDAGRARDAAIAIARPRDAGHARVTIDAGIVGTATLKLGADPWGEIYIDGKPFGTTPRQLAVSAGRHTVEIVYTADTPPRKQTFSVELGAGEVKSLEAEFR